MDLRSVNIAVVGATGAVGREMLGLLAERGVPAGRVRALASARSAGGSCPYGGSTLRVNELSSETLSRAELALMAASSDVAREWAPVALEAGADVIDNSSAFRMDPSVPLVTPEVNPEAVPPADVGARLIANPNCSTIIMLMAVAPLYRAFGVRGLIVSTYQAVSGAGAAAIDELRDQSLAVLEGREPTPRVFSEVCAFNVFSHDSALSEATGRNQEEDKLIRETRKMLADDSIRISATCVRVPVIRAHTEAIHVELGRPASEQEVRAAIEGAPGVVLVDDRKRNCFPTPRTATGRDEVLVGRIRASGDEGEDGDGRRDRFDLLCCGDQLRKGAALNAVQIAELMEPRGNGSRNSL